MSIVFMKNIILKLLLRLLHLLFAEKIHNLIFLRNKYLFGMSRVYFKNNEVTYYSQAFLLRYIILSKCRIRASLRYTIFHVALSV